MKKLAKSTSNVVAKLALQIAKNSANSTCVVISHQPKLPKAVDKLRKN